MLLLSAQLREMLQAGLPSTGLLAFGWCHGGSGHALVLREELFLVSN